jgi:hypothetical protein
VSVPDTHYGRFPTAIEAGEDEILKRRDIPHANISPGSFVRIREARKLNLE